MKTYKYRIVVIYPGSPINEHELNQWGEQGFKLVDSVTVFRPDSTVIGHDSTQLIMEKEEQLEMLNDVD